MWIISCVFRSPYTGMNSLSSMSPSCLQSRDSAATASSYYSMFHHDSLSSLSSYGRSCGVASQSAASGLNSHMGSYGSSLTSSSSSSASGSATGMTWKHQSWRSGLKLPIIQEFSAPECRCLCKFRARAQTLPPTTGPDSSEKTEARSKCVVKN